MNNNNIFVANYFSKEEERIEDMSKTLYCSDYLTDIHDFSADYLKNEVIGNLLACDEGKFKIDETIDESSTSVIMIVTDENGNEKARITISKQCVGTKAERVYKAIKDFNSFDGVCYEKYLNNPIPFGNEQEVVRVILDGDAVVCHILDKEDKTWFIGFVSLSEDIQNKIYNDICR